MGAAIAYKVGNPALALPLAFASHFVLELVPHWNPHLYTELKKYGKVTTQSTMLVAADVVLSLAFGFFIAAQALPDFNRGFLILLGAFVAVLPDIVEGPYFFLGARNALIEKWVLFQRGIQSNAPLPIGILTQVLILAAAFWWLFS